MHYPKRIAFISMLFVFSLQSVFANPSPEEEKAKELFTQAEVQYKLRNFKEAVQLYLDAYQLSEKPALLFNIGQCYRYLAQPEEAIRIYRLYLQEVPDSSYREEVEKHIEALTTLLNDNSVLLFLTSTPEGAEVHLGGPEGPVLGKTPYQNDTFEIGTHRVTLTLEGYKPWSKELILNRGKDYVFPSVYLEKISIEEKNLVEAATKMDKARHSQWLSISLSPHFSALNADDIDEDLGLGGLGIDIAYLCSDVIPNTNLGVRLGASGAAKINRRNNSNITAIQLGAALEPRISLTEKNKSFLELGFDAGLAFVGAKDEGENAQGVIIPLQEVGGFALYANVRPTLSFLLREKRLLFFRPLSFGIVRGDAFTVFQVDFFSVGYSWGLGK